MSVSISQFYGQIHSQLREWCSRRTFQLSGVRHAACRAIIRLATEASDARRKWPSARKFESRNREGSLRNWRIFAFDRSLFIDLLIYDTTSSTIYNICCEHGQLAPTVGMHLPLLHTERNHKLSKVNIAFLL